MDDFLCEIQSDEIQDWYDYEMYYADILSSEENGAIEQSARSLASQAGDSGS